jgi:hypothetical protein
MRLNRLERSLLLKFELFAAEIRPHSQEGVPVFQARPGYGHIWRQLFDAPAESQRVVPRRPLSFPRANLSDPVLL